MIKVKNINKSYPKGGSLFGRDRMQVLSEVTFDIQTGECLGLIGESGSGKSTLARLIMGLEKPDKGEIIIDGQPVQLWQRKNPGKISVVFQDYTSSVNPRFTVEKIIAEPLISKRQGENIKKKVLKLLDRVGLPEKLLERYPHEVSGGQLQRVCIARAIALNPRFIVLDEAISSLDVSIRAQILDLFWELKNDLRLTYLFITHDLQAAASLCDRMVFLYQGKIEENLVAGELANAKNEFVKKLLDSVIAFEIL